MAERKQINTALRQWARGVTFTIAMGRRQVFTLVSLHLSQNRMHMRDSMVGRAHRHMSTFITTAHCLIERGLVDAIVWRDLSLQAHNATKGKKIGELWRVTPAGELIVGLLKEAGIYDEVRAELEHADAFHATVNVRRRA